MRSTTRSPGRWAWHRTTPQDRAFRLALVVLVALILAGLLASCSEVSTGANRAVDGVRDLSERFDLAAERFFAPVRDALQAMATSLRSTFGRFVGRFP